MASLYKTLSDPAPADESEPPALYIDEQNILIQNAWQWFGCLAPFALFWLGVLIIGALTGW